MEISKQQAVGSTEEYKVKRDERSLQREREVGKECSKEFKEHLVVPQ